MAEELRKRFPALSLEVCKEMLAIEATESQLQKRNKRAEQEAAAKVSAFIPKQATSGPHHKVLNLVLVGKTGVGKSATGNLILGTEFFKASSSTESVTQQVKGSECEINGVTVRVVDTPGFIDTTRDKEAIATELLKVGVYCKEGIHAFVFLRNLGNPRNTPEEMQAFEEFKEVFSKKVLGHCVFLFTRAIELLHMPDLEQKTINGWVNQFLKEDAVYKGVDFRIVGVENVNVTPLEKQIQRESLVSYIQAMMDAAGGKPFDLEVFTKAKEENEKAIKQEQERQRQIQMDKVKENIIVKEIPKAVNACLINKSRHQLAKIAEGKGTFSSDVEALCRSNRSFVDHRGVVERLLKHFAKTLVNKTFVGQAMRLSVKLFGFAFK